MSDVLVNAIADPDALVLFGRTGEFEFKLDDFFYLHASDAEKLPNDWRDCVEPDATPEFVRVRWPSKLRGSRWSRLRYFNENVFEPRGIRPLEADVDPVQRFLIENPRVQIADDWRLFWYDLETKMIEDWDRVWRTRILSFSWSSSNGERGHVRLEADTDAAEKALLQKFIDLANGHDVLLAWNGSRFDDPVVQNRAVELGVSFDPMLYHWIDHLWLFKRYFQRSEDGGVTQSFALDSIAAAFLGTERKVPIAEVARARGFKSGDLFAWCWENEPGLLEEYNDQDVELMRKLEEKTGFIKLHFALCQLCRILPTRRSLYATSHVDGRMLQRGHETGYRFPSKPMRKDGAMGHRARGAFVPDAVTGLHESVAVLDFARMYPSIIQTFNMSLETIDPSGDLAVPETTPKGRATGDVVARFRSAPEGHLPAALRGVLQYRQQYKERMAAAEVGTPDWYDANRLQTACKILANTFYGVVLSPVSRYHVHAIGESVTSFGRHLLHSAIETAAAKGHDLVFGDTDSVAFVATDEEAAAVRDEFNDVVLPGLIADCGADPGLVELEYEKRFSRIVVTASKRYAGRFALYDGKPTGDDAPMDVRGLEIVRSDVCVAARRLQRSTLEGLLDGQNAKGAWAELRRVRDELVAGGTPIADLVLRKGLTKQPHEYKNKPVQAKVADQMAERGMEVWVGSKVSFLMTPKGPVIPEDVKGAGELDLHLYWNQYVYPPTERVLSAAFPDHDWEGLNFPRGYDPNQLGFFEASGPSAKRVRRVRRTTGGPDGRPVRRVRAAGPLVVFTVDESIDAKRLRSLADEFPGKCRLRIDVEVEKPRALVEMTCPNHRVASPADEPRFSSTLRMLGVRWEVAAGR